MYKGDRCYSVLWGVHYVLPVLPAGDILREQTPKQLYLVRAVHLFITASHCFFVGLFSVQCSRYPLYFLVLPSVAFRRAAAVRMSLPPPHKWDKALQEAPPASLIVCAELCIEIAECRLSTCLQVRGKLYELLANCIPPDVIIKGLLDNLLKRLDSEQMLVSGPGAAMFACGVDKLAWGCWTT